MVTVGYAQVSTIRQNLDVKIEKLREYGCDEIFEERHSGRSAARPALKECPRHIRRGDVLVTTRLDRLARSPLDLHRILEQLQESEVGFVVLDQATDTATSAGKLVFGVLAAVAEFETPSPERAPGGRDLEYVEILVQGKDIIEKVYINWSDKS